MSVQPTSPSAGALHAGAGRRLLWQGGLYALGNIVLKASGLLLAPLYLNEALLPAGGFGRLVMLEATAQLLVPLVGLGLTTAMLAFLARGDTAHDHDAVPATALVGATLAAGVLLATGLPLAEVAARGLFGDAAYAQPMRLLLFYVAFKVIATVPLTLLRARERVGLYVLAVTLEAGALIGGVYYGLVVRDLGLTGVMQAYAGSAAVGTLLLVLGLLVRSPWRVQPTLAIRLYRFGIPLVLSALALPVLHVGDRYLLEWLATAEELAVYGWGARLSGALNMLLVQSFQSAFTVIGLKALGAAPASGALHERVFRHLTAWAGWGALGLALIAHDLTALLSSSELYLQAAPLVMILSLGYVFYGIVPIANNVFYARGQTRLVALSVAAAALLNVGLNMLLIPWLGGLGAALATLISYAALGVGLLARAQRHLGRRFPIHVLAVIVAVCLALWALGQVALDWSPWARAGYYGLLMVAYPAVLIGVRAYPWHVLREAIEGVRGRLAAGRPGEGT